VESLGSATSTSVDGKLHIGDLLVDILHELNDEIDELALVKGLSVDVGDEEADIVGDGATVVKSLNDGLATKHKEVISTLGKEAHETLCKDGIELIKLLEADADANAVHRSLDENTLLLVTRDNNGVAKQLLAHPALNLRLVVALHNLTGKVCDAHSSSDGATDGVSVWLNCSSHSVNRV